MKLPGRRKLVGPVVFIGLAILGVAWAVGSVSFRARSRDVLPPEGPPSEHRPNAIAVTMEPVTLRSVQRTVETVGTLYAFEQVTLSAKVEGRVRRILHDVGDRMKPGELLLEIDPTDFDLSVQQAQRGLDVEMAKLGLAAPPTRDFNIDHLPSVIQASVKAARAKERVARARALVERNAMSRDELSNMMSDYQSLVAEHDNQVLLAKSGLSLIQMKQQTLAIAKQQLKDTRIEAPLPSMMIPVSTHEVAYGVTSRTAAEGSLLLAGTEVFKLVIDQLLKLKVPVPDRYVAQIVDGQKVKVTTAAYDRAFEGIVTRINPSVDTGTRTFEVEIQVPNPDGALKSGSFAKATIVTRQDAATPTVPLEAVVRYAGVTKMFLAENGLAHEIQVTPGVSTDQWIEITSPKLSKDAQVITSGQSILADGTAVYARPSATAARELKSQAAE